MLSKLQWILFLIVSFFTFSNAVFAESNVNIPILCYHNLNPTTPGSMNMTPQKFESQLRWLKDNGFTFIRLSDAVEYLQGKRSNLPAKPIVITADDGWKSVYTYMFPIVSKLNVPVTLFIYPTGISSSKNYMTWEELKTLQKTGLFDIQSHTHWHPNFKHEKKKRSAEAYEKFVQEQLVQSKKILEEKLGMPVSYLAWPFGIYDDFLQQQASRAGYVMAFTIDARKATPNFKPMAQPRYMVVDGLTMKTFIAIVSPPKHAQPVVSASKQ